MARPWEYPRWRRILMQVAMWVIFGASLGLAQLVVRQHQHTPILLDPRIRLGPVWVRLPHGWAITSGQDADSFEIEVADPDQPEEITIAVQRIPEGQKGGQGADQPGAGTQPIYFKGLGRQGVMAVVPQRVRTPDGLFVRETLLAYTELPSGYVVEIELVQGSGKLGAGERRLVEAVANEITSAGPMPPVKHRSTLPQGTVQYY